MGKPTVTSVKVDEDIWKEAKKKAIDEDITLQDLLNEAVEDWLRKKGKKP
jgi:DNA-binding protein YbaB